MISYNSDGLIDLVIANTKNFVNDSDKYSALTLYKNIGTKKLPKFEFVTDNFLHVRRQTSNQYGTNRLLPAFGDVDRDGDLDVFFTDQYGSWHVGINKPIAGEMHLDTFIHNIYGLDNFKYGSIVLDKIDKDTLLDMLIGFDAPSPYFFPNYDTGKLYGYCYESNKKNTSFGNCSFADSADGVFYNLHPVLQIAKTDNSGKRYLYAGTSLGNVLQYEINEDSVWKGGFKKIKQNVLPYNSGFEAGLAIGDINDDGLMEFFVGNVRGGLTLYTMGTIDNAVMDTFVSASIDDIEDTNLNIEVYPNPANEMLQVRSESIKFNQIDILDMTGRVMMSVLMDALDADIRVSDMKSGMYILKIHASRNISQKIFIKD
jgi:hypothetical protein